MRCPVCEGAQKWDKHSGAPVWTKPEKGAPPISGTIKCMYCNGKGVV